MVEAGEAAGILDDVLDRLATQIEKEANLKRRVKGAMIYPTLVISFAFLVLIAMLLFIVPIFQKLYKQFGGQLPTLTQFMITMSELMRTRWYIIFPAIGLSLFLLLPLEERARAAGRSGTASSCAIPMKIGDVVLR